MRDSHSLPVFRNMGRAETGKDQVTRTYFCKHTNRTKTIVKHTYIAKTGNGEGVRRSSTISRTPARPISAGFHTKEEKRKEAEERNANRASLSHADQLARLDARLGKGVGAVRERARLLSLATLAASVSNKVVKNAAGQKMTQEEKGARKALHAQQARQAQR